MLADVLNAPILFGKATHKPEFCEDHLQFGDGPLLDLKQDAETKLSVQQQIAP